MQSDTKQMCPFVSFFAHTEGMRFFCCQKGGCSNGTKAKFFSGNRKTRQAHTKILDSLRDLIGGWRALQHR